jgi:acetyl-CoA C-acetyltransferase
MTACITGWSHAPFGKMDALDVEGLLATVAGPAIADAGLAPEDIDAVFLGHFNSGFSDQDFGASLVFNAVPGLRFKPATRLENACATGSAAVHAGLDAIAAGRATNVLVLGVEKMTGRPGREIGDILLHAAYRKEESDIEGGFAGLFARIAEDYFARHGDQSEVLAHIAAKNHANGAHNPYAQMRKDLGFDFCNTVSDKNPIVVGKLRRTDCSLVSDGAAALVLSAEDAAQGMKKAVRVRARAQVNELMPMSGRDMTRFEGGEQAWAKALAEARMTLDDLSLVETHDCFTIAELVEYEAMGLTPPGQGARAILEGWTHKDGRLPVNPSGGLKAKGHPIGATGVSMHVLGAMQVAGEAGAMQVADATTAGIFNMGGAAVANYVTILERAR